MLIWRNVGRSVEKRERMLKEMEEDQIYSDIQKAKAEWERAVRQFEEALGEDEIDYAIYVLEAAERKYQIHLKRAKRVGVTRVAIGDRGLGM
jgi:hypothetical protein